ncbi:hypothetical protein BDN72DRAFT_831482 [Pluteus cervinus]|uniref:Uncharacterized protein n=1 Tax=Pluteus cervinus TaxID=181527 RepID=A0ACD3BE82_9AGAR|nr:hypothetical protein BDN72DRAFT_831482 [Pluteus cervinus]
MHFHSAELESSYVLPHNRPRSNYAPSISSVSIRRESDEDEFSLLGDVVPAQGGTVADHGIITAPILSREAYEVADFDQDSTQYGVLGSIIATVSMEHTYIPQDPRLYVNTNAPFSAVVCGVQGSGKSHTVSVLLENMFVTDCPPIGSLKQPLAGLVLHFGEGGPGTSPCEAAWLARAVKPGITPPRVSVYVSKSSLNTMRAVYAPLGENVTVEPLYFDESELDAQAFLTMMALDQAEELPLYAQIILSILRDLGENYSFKAFTNQLQQYKEGFNPKQKSALAQRLSLITSFLNPAPSGEQTRRFASGQLTIIDLSDPFIDAASACGIFEIMARVFQRERIDTGKVTVVDEAHKYISANQPTRLTTTLLEMIRLQRHLAMRVIISTQEPTVVPPALLDLCSIVIIHRFSSPSWWEHIVRHATVLLEDRNTVFDRLVNLQTGQAIVLAPSGLGVTRDPDSKVLPGQRVIEHFGRSYLLIKTRRRVTADGGASVLVLPSTPRASPPSTPIATPRSGTPTTRNMESSWDGVMQSSWRTH